MHIDFCLVPGKPSNLTYQVVDCHPDNDYCHLNISWLHPYQQNTTITSFNINLNKTVSNQISSHITELLKIYNATYQPIYYFQVLLIAKQNCTREIYTLDFHCYRSNTSPTAHTTSLVCNPSTTSTRAILRQFT